MMRPTSNRNRAFDSWRRRPALERLETRQLLDGGVGSLTGTVLIDATGAPVPGVTVQLLLNGAVFRTAQSDTSGRYAFTGLGPGRYTLVAALAGGQTLDSAHVFSQVYQAAANPAGGIDVTIPDPNSVWVNYLGVESGKYVSLQVAIAGKTIDNAAGLLRATVGTSQANPSNLNAGLDTFCLDDLTNLPFSGPTLFRVLPSPITNLTDRSGATPRTVPADRAGRVAWLFDTYGLDTAKLTATQAAGLQLALWELIYDTGSTPDFHAGNFSVGAPIAPSTQADVDAAVAAAVTYFNASAGHNDPALLLDAPAVNDTSTADGYQSLIATQHYDFSLAVTPLSSISGYVYCDPELDGVRQPDSEGIGGVTITLTGTDNTGHAVFQTTTTTAAPDTRGHDAGYYAFNNLQPGTYTITEGPAAGYIHVTQTQGTPGGGTVSTRRFSNIPLAANVHGENNNFGEVLPPVEAETVQLLGIHQQQSQIVMQLTGEVDPSQVTNPANYTVIDLGKDETYGTRDDRNVGIASVTYDSATNTVTVIPARHLNIHYHYLVVAKFNQYECTPASTVVRVIGRADVPYFVVHGKTVAPPAMLDWQVRHSQKVVNQTYAKLAKAPAPTASRVKAMAMAKAATRTLVKPAAIVKAAPLRAARAR